MDLTGEVFGRLIVLSYVDRVNRNKRWLCQCSCERLVIVYGSNLKCGTTKSCGCLRRELAIKRATIHGGYRTPTYSSWHSMKNRCYNKKSLDYPHYGGRGIRICRRWFFHFKNFLEDMGERPTGTSIDRIDVNGHYTPDNCKWSTPSEQNSNKRKRY